MGDALPKIVQHQLLKGFCVQLFRCYHFCPIGGFFGFNNYAYRTFCLVAVVDNKIVTAFGVYKMVRVVVGFLQKIGNQVFMEFLALGIVGTVQQCYKISLKTLNLNAVWFYFQEGFIYCLSGFLGFWLHLYALVVFLG